MHARGADEVRVVRRTVAVAPESRHPSYFDSIDLSVEERLLADLRQAGLDKVKSPVYIQSFEVGNLRELRRLGARTALVQLKGATGGPVDRPGTTYAAMTAPTGLAEIASYAGVLGSEQGADPAARRRGESTTLGAPTPTQPGCRWCPTRCGPRTRSCRRSTQQRRPERVRRRAVRAARPVRDRHRRRVHRPARPGRAGSRAALKPVVPPAFTSRWAGRRRRGWKQAP